METLPSPNLEEDEDTSITAMLNSWDGKDKNVALQIWPSFKEQILSTTSTISKMLFVATHDPNRFATLLTINQSPYLSAAEVPSAKLCTTALLLTLFDWCGHWLYQVLQDMGNIKGLPDSEKGKTVLCKLMWIVHCLAVFFPNRYPAIREHFQIPSNKKQELNLLDILQCIPGSMLQYMHGMPFESTKIFLRCFGANKFANFLTPHPTYGVEVTKTFPAVSRLVSSLDLVDHILERKCIGNFYITDSDAIDIALKVYDIHPCYWSLESANSCGLVGFQKGFLEWKTCWEANPKAPQNAVRKLYDEKVKRQKGVRRGLTDDSPMSEAVDDTLLEKRPTDEERASTVQGFLSAHGLSANQSKKRKRKDLQNNLGSVFKEDMRRTAMEVAANHCTRIWNKDGRPLDCQLKSGLVLRSKFSAPENRQINNQSILKVKVHKLGTGGAPCVVYFENAFSDWFLETDKRVTNETAFCKVNTSDGGSSSIGAFYHCGDCESRNSDDLASSGFAGPLMKVGANNSVTATRASEWEKLKMKMANEITDSVIMLTNDLLEAAQGLQLTEDGEAEHNVNIRDIQPEATVNDNNIIGGLASVLLEAAQSLQLTEDGEAEHNVDVRDIQPEATITDNNIIGGLASVLLSSFTSKVNPQRYDVTQVDFRKFPRQSVNCNICKVGNKAKYSQHQDSSEILNSPPTNEIKCTANKDILPRRSDMVVLTMVTGSGSCEARVSWHRNGQELLDIVTDNNCIHFQLAGVQDDGIMHQSDVCHKRAAVLTRNDTQTLVIRKIDTYRMTLCPCCDAAVYRDQILADELDEKKRRISWINYCRINVMDKNMREILGGRTIVEISDKFDSDDHAKDELQQKTGYTQPILPCAKFENPNAETLMVLVSTPRLHSATNRKIRSLQPLERSFALPYKTRHENIRHHEFVAAAFDKECYFNVVRDDNNPVLDQPQFLHSREGKGATLLLPGDTYQFHELPINHTRNSTAVVMPDLPSLAVFVHAYKNDPRTFRKWHDMILNMQSLNLDCDEDFNTFENIYNDIGDLYVNGFAGSQMAADSVAPTAKSLSMKEPTFRTGFSQKASNKENSIFNMIEGEGRVVAVFISPYSWGDPLILQKRPNFDPKNKENLKDEVVFLGYCYISKYYRSEPLSKEEVYSRFSDMGDYVKKEKTNITHMYEKFFQYVFSPVFTANQVKTLVQMRSNKKCLQPITITESSKEPLVVFEKKIMSYLEHDKRVRDADETDVTSVVVRQYMCKHLDCFFKAVGAKGVEKDDDDFGVAQSYLNAISVDQAAVIAMHVQVAAAMRFQRRNVLVDADHTKEHTITPLLGDDSDLLPDSLRLYPLPCTNGDLDVVTQFGLSQMRIFHDHMQQTYPQILQTSPRFLSKHDLKSPCIIRLVWQCLFMATLNRFTGNVPLICQYQNALIEGMHLPHFEDLQNFLLFLDKLEQSPFSLQHRGMIPAGVRECQLRLRKFFHNLATSIVGFEGLLHRITSRCSAGEGLLRNQLMYWIVECLDKCGDFQGGSERLGFLSNKIVADVEAMFPAFADAPDDDAVVQLGWGSKNGLACINIDQESGKASNAMSKNDNKFWRFHKQLLKFYLDKDTPEELVNASGWRVQDGTIVSSWSGRPYAISDTEHLLCKVWVALMRSSSCRNISRAPKLSANHCYPLRIVQPWEEDLQPVMMEIMDSFLRFSRTIEFHSDYTYAAFLLFPAERKEKMIDDSTWKIGIAKEARDDTTCEESDSAAS